MFITISFPNIWNHYFHKFLFQADQQREMEGLLDNVRQLTRELRLQMLIIDTYIPPEYQAIVDENVAWNEDIGEWQLKCVAYTGNNMRKRAESEEREREAALGTIHILRNHFVEGGGPGGWGQRRPKMSRIAQICP